MGERRQIPPTYVGNHPQMLRDINDTLRHLRNRQPTPEALNGNGTTNAPRQPPRRISGQHAKALAEIRSSLEPYAASESGYSSCSECSTPSAETVNRQFLNQLKAVGYDEVSRQCDFFSLNIFAMVV